VAIEKLHKEFHPLDLDEGWEVPPGYPHGFEQKILAGRLDEANKRGGCTRLLRIKPGAFSSEPFVHEYWEEVYLLSGDLIVGNDENGSGGEKFEAPTYACPKKYPHAGMMKSAELWHDVNRTPSPDGSGIGRIFG
jgi:hypothetical protein